MGEGGVENKILITGFDKFQKKLSGIETKGHWDGLTRNICLKARRRFVFPVLRKLITSI